VQEIHISILTAQNKSAATRIELHDPVRSSGDRRSARSKAGTLRLGCWYDAVSRCVCGKFVPALAQMLSRAQLPCRQGALQLIRERWDRPLRQGDAQDNWQELVAELLRQAAETLMVLLLPGLWRSVTTAPLQGPSQVSNLRPAESSRAETPPRLQSRGEDSYDM
jgi:hypothetical protein